MAAVALGVRDHRGRAVLVALEDDGADGPRALLRERVALLDETIRRCPTSRVTSPPGLPPTRWTG